MFNFKRKTKVTSKEMAEILNYLVYSKAIKVIEEDHSIGLEDLGLELANKDYVFYELVALHMFITIRLFTDWLKDEFVRNAILDGMHSSYYKTLQEDSKFSDEDIKQVRDFHIQRYAQYNAIMETENEREWLKELAKGTLTNLHGEVCQDIIILTSMISYISAEFIFTPKILDSYKLVL